MNHGKTPTFARLQRAGGMTQNEIGNCSCGGSKVVEFDQFKAVIV